MSQGDWWRPQRGSKWEERLQFVAAAATILTGSFALAGITWSLASTLDGRMKALLWWCFGATAAGAFVLFRLMRREFIETRYARALEPLHQAHHTLRDAAYGRYIARQTDGDWGSIVEKSLREFAAGFTIAIGAPCHVTIKTLVDSSTDSGESTTSPDNLLIRTDHRSAPRPHIQRAGVSRNTVGNNTDFRYLFNPENNDNRCWMHNDLLTLEMYENPHWPENPSPRNVPYRATMVWPIRKVLRPGTATTSAELFVHGFLTVDSPEPDVFTYERHFPIGAAYADHLLGVLWDPEELRKVYKALSRDQPAADSSAPTGAP